MDPPAFDELKNPDASEAAVMMPRYLGMRQEQRNRVGR
jgi:hypothetical protein